MLYSKKVYKKIATLAFFKFFVSFVYVVLTNLKEPLIVLAADSGAEVLPVLKGYLVFPASIFFVLTFNWLANRFKPTKLFFFFMLFFLGFFLLYNFILSPNAAWLSPTAHASKLLAKYPNQKHWIAVYRHWVHALAFIFIELYGQVAIFVIFWGIANDLCSTQEARSFYHFIIASGCLGGILATETHVILLKRQLAEAAYATTAFAHLFWVAIAGIILIIAIYGYIYRQYYYSKEDGTLTQKVQEQPPSFLESLRYIFSNYYLLAIAIMVIACGLTMNLVDVTYKANLKKLYSGALAYPIFTARVREIGLLISALATLFISRKLMASLGWKISSYIAPIGILVTGIIFFITSKFRNHLTFLAYYQIDPLEFVVYLGVFQTLIGKLVKYAFFDGCKEIAYLSLDKDVRIKGKGAVDIVGSRAGKSFSGHIHTILLAAAGTANVLDLTHILMIFLVIIGFAWFWAVGYLDKNIKKNKPAKSNKVAIQEGA